MVGLVDEREGGIIAYFVSEDVADRVALELNDFVVTEDCRYWVTHQLDEYQIKDLKESING